MRLSGKLAALAFCLLVSGASAMDHSSWDTLLKQYVNAQSRVDYKTWKENGLKTLDDYLERLAGTWPSGMPPNAEKAVLINAYNAHTIRWILANYPVKSVWETSDPFKAQRHVVNNRKMSLDEIESRLRTMGDPRIHAALVCAARSCPPLRREAYVADRLDRQLDDNARAWLSSPDLNEFLPERKLARISSIFKWYGQDFEQGGRTLLGFLARYAPAGKAGFLGEGKVNIEYKNYHWGLNDSSGLGSDYSKTRFLWDRFRNVF